MTTMSLKDRVALITGGAKGIGLATAKVFSREGARVVIGDRDSSAGQQAVETLGPGSAFIRADVSKADDIKQLVEGVAARFGRIDFLINCAGIIRYATAVTCTEEEWDEVLNVNLKSSFLCSKYVIPVMKKSTGGVIINVASAQAHISSSNMVHYTTSKSALLGLTRSLAIDFAPSIRAIAVCPGTIDTPMARNAWATSGNPEGVLQDSIDMHVLKRIGRPEEVAELIVFLCSDKATFITGQYIRIDGGLGINVPGSVNDARETTSDLN
jgi:NAD(P)-dependent dehydrogenase (short-subunit alcohol dehydrogenase family)